MSNLVPPTQDWMARPSLFPERAKWLRRLDAVAQIIGMSALVIGYGLRHTGVPPWEFGAIVIFCMALITLGIGVRYRWSLAQRTFWRRHFSTVLAAGLWTIGMLLVTAFGAQLPDINGDELGGGRWTGYLAVSEGLLALYSVAGLVRGLRNVAAGSVNPAFLLVGSFGVLITGGTVLLMLPVCSEESYDTLLGGAPLLTALFTATSASCVTGLVVEHTGTYWSLTGQLVILLLIQLGGLGIMTFGAFFAAVAGRNVRLTEFATLRELFASEGLGDVRRLVFAILGFTLISEAIGAALLFPLWKEEPLWRQVYMSLFHSVSAFCNAGFALTSDSFVGQTDHWEVRIVLPVLIIVGGLGFAVLYNVGIVLRNGLRRLFTLKSIRSPQERERLRLTSRLVLSTTVVLLVSGCLGIYFLERARIDGRPGIGWADAWFQSVTLRTAGFNTVDIGGLQPATKLLGIVMMAIGASPGSTGGGVKTTVFAVAVVGLLSVLRGRERVEAFGRTIPSTNVNRALAIMIVFMLTIMTGTLLIVIFENRPVLFLDHMFEVASAAGTVGLSCSTWLPDGSYGSITQSLGSASRVVIIMTMFLGRVGPLTLLLALAGEAPLVRYEYPPERVTLG